MSVDNHVLGTSTAVGGAVGAVSQSNNKWLIGIAAGLVTLIILGFLARRLARRKDEE